MNEANTPREAMFQALIHEIVEREKLGLSTVHARNHVYRQGDHNYSHLDIETIKQLSWIEFIEDNKIYKGLVGAHPNQYRKYHRALTWKEIESIEDITK